MVTKPQIFTTWPFTKSVSTFDLVAEISLTPLQLPQSAIKRMRSEPGPGLRKDPVVEEGMLTHKTNEVDCLLGYGSESADQKCIFANMWPCRPKNEG